MIIKLKRKAFVLVTAAMFGMFLINSCMSGNAQPAQTGTINRNLIGVWQREGNYTGNNLPTSHFAFFDNGTFFGYGSSGYAGKYSIYNDILMLNENSNSSQYGSLFTFSISGGTLTLLPYGASEENKTTFKKVK